MTTYELLTDTVEDIKLELSKVEGGIVSEASLLEILELSNMLSTLAQEALDEI